MKSFLKSITLILCIQLLSCEQIDVIENEVPYDPIVVVRAQLIAGKNFEGVKFTKSLPHNVVYTIEKAELKNVTAYLRINEARIIPLKYFSNGLYLPSEPHTIGEGQVYELFAKWGENQIYAKTKIPNTPSVRSAKVIGNYLQGEVLADQGEVYGATWVVAENMNVIYSEAENFFELEMNNIPEAALIPVRTEEIPRLYQTSYFRKRYFIRIISFDEPYLDYFKTQNVNDPIEDIFAQGAGSVIWNVQGTKTIGMFIGMAKSELIKAN